MKTRLSSLQVAAWVVPLALLVAGLLHWSPAVAAADDDTELAARSRALQRAQQSVLGVQAVAVDEARSARTLGKARSGSGVLIGADGLVLTIGYLVLEAEDVALVHDDGRLVPARVLGYDVATGFGLLQALAPLGLEPVPIGRSRDVALQEPLMICRGATSPAFGNTTSRRPCSPRRRGATTAAPGCSTAWANWWAWARCWWPMPAARQSSPPLVTARPLVAAATCSCRWTC